MGRQGARNEFKGFHADNRRLTLSISSVNQRVNMSVKTVNVCQGSLKIQSTHLLLVGVILDGEAKPAFFSPALKGGTLIM